MSTYKISVGDKVYAWSTERYGEAMICECIVEEKADDTLLLYAIEENRNFYRMINEVMTFEELSADIYRLFNVKLK